MWETYNVVCLMYVVAPLEALEERARASTFYIRLQVRATALTRATALATATATASTEPSS